MSPPSTNTRSRNQARARSKSPVPRFSAAPTRTYSKSVSPKRDSVYGASKPKKTAAEVRNEAIDILAGGPNTKKDELKEKIEEYARTPGTDKTDMLLEFGALSLGAGVTRKFKIVLSGDGGCGKTTLVNHIKGKGFTNLYEATLGADVNNIFFWTSHGECYQVECWDTAGCEKVQGMGDGYFIGAAGCVLVFDVLSRQTYKSLEGRYKAFTRVCPDAPVVVIGNKVDHSEAERKVKPKQAAVWPRKKGVPYFETSVKTGKNVSAGFLSLVRTLTGDRSIEFSKGVRIKADAKQAALAPLPKEDDQGL